MNTVAPLAIVAFASTDWSQTISLPPLSTIVSTARPRFTPWYAPLITTVPLAIPLTYSAPPLRTVPIVVP
jgi:hypothetical protein